MISLRFVVVLIRIIVQKKSAPPHYANNPLWPWPGAPLQPPSRARFSEQETTVWARNNNNCWFLNQFLGSVLEWVLPEQETTTAVHFWVNFWALFWNGFFRSQFLQKRDVLMKTIKRQIVADYTFLTVSFQRPVIWHALGQGPANFSMSCSESFEMFRVMACECFLCQ